MLEGVSFIGYHGVYANEKEEGTLFRVDVTMDVKDLPGFRTDILDDTLNYEVIMSEILEIGRNEKFNLIEHLAWEIQQSILRHPEVESVGVVVHKQVKNLCGGPQWVSVRCQSGRKAEE